MDLIAQLVSDATPVQVLLAVNAATTAAAGIIYRDCRKDREKLWEHVRELESRLGIRR